MNPSICKHFIGHGMPTHCAAGVCYNDVTPMPRSPGSLFRAPCRLPKVFGNPNYQAYVGNDIQGTCDKREFPTAEEVTQSEKEMEAFMDRLRLIDPVIGKLKAEHKGKGFQGVIDCPCCKGKMNVRIAGLNGHAAVKCATEGCCEFIE